ncbi:MAG: lamin tail domain-containing protein [Kiritimatiellae bacterium]|nr:lamin tail domain-containing protein [Kiritimatiellia bacterium]
MTGNRMRATRPLCAAMLIAAAVCADADGWRSVFDPYAVITIYLTMDGNDWDRIRHDQPLEDDSWVPEVAPAQFHAEGETNITVSVRRKGETDPPLPSSGNPQKVSLKIDFNEYVPGQTWRGLRKLSLENGGDEPLEEGFAWILHRLAADAGFYRYEAGNSGWVRLYINGELKGVFTNAEQRDEQLLRNHDIYKEGFTWLYKVDGSTTLELGTPHSQTHLHLTYPPFDNDSPQPDLEADLPQWIDMQSLLTLAAAEVFAENIDGLVTHSGKNSFAVDFEPPYPRRRMYWPWDMDAAIRQGAMSIYGSEPYQVQILGQPWFKQVYEAIFRGLLAGPYSEQNLTNVINAIEAGTAAYFDEDPYVYGGGVAGAFDSLRSWAATRAANVAGQLSEPYIEPPTLSQHGGEVLSGYELTLSAPSGTVYYTTDGTDPRAPGGAVSASASAYSGPLTISETTYIVARARDGSLWSARPAEATFNIANYASDMRITEILYNPRENMPTNGIDNDEYEFIELQNVGSTTLDLTGYFFTGIDYTFPPGATVGPGQYIVLACNPAEFSNRYSGVAVYDSYWGKLSNSGEKIRLRNSDSNTVISVEYDDDPPWVLSPDRTGYSLVNANPDGNADAAENWRASANIDGSPGTADPAPSYSVGVVIHEVLAHTDPPLEDAIELLNTTDSPIDIGGWYLTDDARDLEGDLDPVLLKKFRIPTGTTIPAHGFKVFYEQDFNTDNPDTPFSLSEWGDQVYLSSADANSNLTGHIVGEPFDASENGVSIGRVRTSVGYAFTALAAHTFGVSNPGSKTEFRTGTGASNSLPKIGPVVINEVMYNPPETGPCTNEFVELYNITGADVDLSGWDLPGAGDYTFPTTTVIRAYDFLVVLDTNAGVSAAVFRAEQAIPTNVPIHAHGFDLGNQGEALRLERPNDDTGTNAPDVLVDRVRYNDKSPWPTEANGEGPSLERFAPDAFGDDPLNWRAATLGGSPGAANTFVVGLAIVQKSSWRYCCAASDLGTAWRSLDYSDSGWPDADGILGYGEPYINRQLSYGPYATNKYTTAYFRKEFSVSDDPATITNLTMQANYDDGFVAYINGQEVVRRSMPGGTVSYATFADAGEGGSYEEIDLSAERDALQLGRNVLAVEVHQTSPGSSDLVWDGALSYAVSTAPSVATPVISPSGGEFVEPVTVTITTSTEGATLRYTLDGTTPTPSSPVYGAPFQIDGSLTVKAKGYKSGYNESRVASAVFTRENRTVAFDSAASHHAEACGTANINVRLNVAATHTVAVDYCVSGGSAEPVADYTPADGTLTFAPSATLLAIPVAVLDDSTVEGDEIVELVLTNPVNAALGALATHACVLDNDDGLFLAYNDLAWTNPQLNTAITTYTRGEGGTLVEYPGGTALAATLAVSAGGGGPYFNQGTNAAGGTDAANVFGGIVDGSGVISYGTDLTLTFSNLNRELLYETVLFGNRHDATYTNRLTRFTVSGADCFCNESSSQAAFAGAQDPSVVIGNGYNTQAGQIARFTHIAPGFDGTFLVTVSDGGSASPPKFYVNALKLAAVRAADGDGDGAADWWECCCGLNSNDFRDGAADTDADGFDNETEYRCGTDPTNAASRLQVDSASASGATFSVHIDTAPGRSYSVDHCDSLVLTNWTELTTLTGDGTVREVSDPGSSTRTQRFYRVRLLP